MHHVDHFSHGLLTPVLAYAMSYLGSLLGLLFTARAREASGSARGGWLGLAAVAIGGTGIWVMHFIAMLGFSVTGLQIRYGVGLTLLSALVAIGVVGAGLFVVGWGDFRLGALLVGGPLTGLGVAAMHYMGMSAVRLPGHIDYAAPTVLASVVIAVVAATAALWCTVRINGPLATGGAAAIMGLAVSGMHYTGMAAVSVRADTSLGEPSGASALDFLLPLIIGISVVALVLLLIIAVTPPKETITPGPLGYRPARQNEATPPDAGRWFTDQN